MDNTEIITSHDVIGQSYSNDQREAYEQIIENLETEDLVAINDYLNAGVPAGSDWRDYAHTFATYEWYEFAYAFRHSMDRDFSLD